MNNSNKPQLTLLKIGDKCKVLQVTGTTGMNMPDHQSTHEAVIIVQMGSAVLTMKETDYMLQGNESFIIPAGETHALRINENFQAIVIMPLDSEIEFKRTMTYSKK